MKKILGLDLGTNSIGWALTKLDFDNKVGEIIDIGSRIIPKSQDELGKFESGQSVSQTAERTGFRGVRRLRERHLLRRERLHRVLNILGFLPEHYTNCIDFDKYLGQFIEESEPKIAYRTNTDGKSEFVFMESFLEMLGDFKTHQPLILVNKKGENALIPYDWTIYYLRKKALTKKIEKEELAWLLLNFNQKRGYYQLRGEEEEGKLERLVEFHTLKVIDVIDTNEINAKKQFLYKIVLENGWEFIKPSNLPVGWKDKLKDFIVTTDLDEEGRIKLDKYGKEKRSFRAPSEDDWTLLKKKTEFEIDKSNKTVGCFIYDILLQKPSQKINGKLVRTIERKFYKEELELILNKQREFHPELTNFELLNDCISELYENNEAHRSTLEKKNFTHLFVNDIIFYQRPLKSKKSLISNCRYEKRYFKDKEGNSKIEPVKCIAKSNPLFQEFRLWQFIQNLKIYERDKKVDGIQKVDYDITAEFLKTEDDYTKLFEWLNERKEIDQKAFLKYFKLKEDNYRWNNIEEKLYPCNETHNQIVNRLSKVQKIPENFLTSEIEESLWHILYSVEDKKELEKALNSFALKHTLSIDFVEHFKKFPPFKKEYGSYSTKAIKKLLPLMRMGKLWDESFILKETKDRINSIIERLKSVNYDKKKIEEISDDYIPKQVLKSFVDCRNPIQGLNTFQACYAVYGRHSEENDSNKWRNPEDIDQFLLDFKQHSLRNPIVEQVITETLRVVRDIWSTHGKGEENFFDEIHIELGREMKNPAEDRKQMTKTISENENTNLRIKSLLIELLNHSDVENVRPYSPAQQEILKIYEDGILKSNIEIPEDILKISKNVQPSKSELIRYILWLEQKYRSPYTGDIIPLGKLFTPAYEIEHIIPQSRYFDDSLSNKIICESDVNKDKDNATALEYIKNNSGKKIELSGGKEVTLFTIDHYEKFVKEHYSSSRSKMKKLLMDDIPDSFIQRQLNDTRYISKMVKNLLSNIVREEGELETTSKNVSASNGSITSTLKQDWGLNDIWNDIISPRFERLNELTHSNQFGEWTNKDGKSVFQTQIPLELSKGFTKKRIDHRHHALDALVIACATKNHINYLNNVYAKTENERFDLRKKLKKIDERTIEKVVNGEKKAKRIFVAKEFYKPWGTFTQDAKEALLTTIVSFKQNLRVINKTSNKYQRWRKDENGNLKKIMVKQEKGENWAIRKPLHKDTVSGHVSLKFSKMVQLSSALDNWKMIVDKRFKEYIKGMVNSGLDKNKIIKHLKELENKWENKDISKVEIYYFDPENAATRVNLGESFDSKTIESITDTGIQKILMNHLQKFDEIDSNGKVKEHPELAFSSDGLDELNKNIKELNKGKNHQPIYKVRKFEPIGNKFNIGEKGNKKDKYVETAKGTNLFFVIYSDEVGKRSFETIPLNIVIDNLKNGLKPLPEQDSHGNKLRFYLSPNDLVYLPSTEEIDNHELVDFNCLSSDQIKRIYKTVSSSGYQCFFVRNEIAVPIVNKLEFSALNKTEKSIEGDMIKEFCWKLEINRLGKIKRVFR